MLDADARGETQMAAAKSRTHRLCLAVALGTLLTATSPALMPAAHAQGPESVADLAAGLVDSVVNISTSQTIEGSRGIPVPQAPEGSPFQEFFDEFFNRQKDGQEQAQPRKVQSLGSGFVIDASGIIVTNNHVIEGADEIVANFNDGSKLTATLLGRDEKTDIAVLQVKPSEAKPLKALKFGSSDAMRVGDWVMAIGNPFGLGGTVTVGIVSARNRDINSGPYDNFIQTDAAINRGNSGGPLFNMNGEIIGINTAIISPSGGSIGIGFAIPSDAAVHVIQQLREFGETRRGLLGVRIQQVTDEIAESLGMGPARGALVAGVTEKGPAAEAGILPGDVILSFDGKPIAAMRDLPRLVADSNVDKLVDVVVIRKGKELTLKVKVGRLTEAAEKVEDKQVPEPVEPPKPVVTELLGLTLSELTPELRTQFAIAPEVKGVVITKLASGSAAAEKGIAVGEVVVEVSQEPVALPDDVAKRVDALKKDGRRSALFLIANKAGELRFVPLKLDE
jgi:serine protease Do